MRNIDKPFWFPIDPKALLSDTLIDQMTTTEFGACMRLLCRQWIDGYLPNDKEQIRRLSRLSESDIESAWSSISRFFPISDSDSEKRVNIYANTKRQEITNKMAERQTQAIKASNVRWNNSDLATSCFNADSIANSNPIVITKDIDKVKTKEKQNKNISLSYLKTDFDKEAFEYVWKYWPKRQDGKYSKGERTLAEITFNEILSKENVTAYDLMLCADWYRKNYPTAQQGYIKQIATFFNHETGLWREILVFIQGNESYVPADSTDDIRKLISDKVNVSKMLEKITNV